jgi:hypothetical protein
MRVFAMALCVVLGTSSAALAQGGFGVKAGVNFANLDFSDSDSADASFDRRSGLVAGVFGVFPLQGKLALQTEVLFSQQGTKITEGGESGEIKLDFIEVPVMLRWSSTGDTGFHLFGGPSFGFRRDATGEFAGDEEDLDEDVEKTNIGIVVGAGLEVGHFIVDARHTWGLSNLNKDSSDPETVKSRVFTVMAGWRF